MISILIPTLNEASNLNECLSSVRWSNDIVVFDSFSVDCTPEIARCEGARVVQRQFDNYAAHRNAALKEVSFRHSWVLMLDADERVPDDLATEIQDAVEGADESVTMFRMRRKDMFQGRWLKRSSGYPTWFGRLVRPTRVEVRRAVNEEYMTDGRIRHLKAHLEHYPFRNGLARWIERHNRYSSMEAEAVLADSGRLPKIQHFTSADPVVRRRALKRLMYTLPARPALVATYLYVVRGGFLDGMPGLTYARLRYIYERFIDLKIAELERKNAGRPL